MYSMEIKILIALLVGYIIYNYHLQFMMHACLECRPSLGRFLFRFKYFTLKYYYMNIYINIELADNCSFDTHYIRIFRLPLVLYRTIDYRNNIIKWLQCMHIIYINSYMLRVKGDMYYCVSMRKVYIASQNNWVQGKQMPISIE